MDDLTLAKMYCAKAQSAMQRNLEFTLTLNQYKKLLTQKTCYYTGAMFSETNPDLKRTLERLDPLIGYTNSNTVAVCHAANVIKAAHDMYTHKDTFTQKQSAKLLRWLLKNHTV